MTDDMAIAERPRPHLHVDIMREVFEHIARRVPRPSASAEVDTAPLDPSLVSQLATFALVCREWQGQAIAVLWKDISRALAHDGYFAPSVLSTLVSNPSLAACVRTLHVTATLEGALWQSVLTNEGDVFAALVRACPNLCDVVVPSFEVASRDNVLDALKQARFMRRFTIRVYLESARRSSRFSGLIPYFDWDLITVADLIAHWPLLESFVVRHVPADAYHMRPDTVLAPPEQFLLPRLPDHACPLRRLELRETFINDFGLFHLIGQNALTELTVMSCQGITSSAITKNGLLQAIAMTGSTLKKLTIMTPWLPTDSGPKLIVDEAITYCTALTHLTVAGWDVSDNLFTLLPSTSSLVHLGVTDFESISPSGLLLALQRRPAIKGLKRLAVWQRNGGLSATGSRIATGWFSALFERSRGPLADALAARGVKIGTGWESRLLSGGELDYWSCAGSSLTRQIAAPLEWQPPASR